jgi:hypothetical protein
MLLDFSQLGLSNDVDVGRELRESLEEVDILHREHLS